MIISNLQTNKLLITTKYTFLCLIALFLGSLCCVSCTQEPRQPQNPALQTIEQHIWQKETALGQELLQTQDTLTYSQDDKNIYQLYAEHLHLLQQGSKYQPDKINALADYFQARKMYKEAGQAAFIQGRVHIIHNEEGQAMLCFKQAEEFAEKDTLTSTSLLAELYYQIARCYRVEKLSIMAYTYCEKVLPLAYQTHNYFLLSETYKLMANIQSDKRKIDKIPTQTIAALYDSALHYYHLTPNRHRGNYHVISYNRAELIADTAAMILHSRYLVDSINFLPNAIILTGHYLRNNQPDSARYYLTKFAPDTLSDRRNTRWSKEQFAYYNAYCHLQENHTTEAAVLFKQLYESLTHELAETEQTRTYQVSRQYDVEKEQRERLEVEVQKQNLTILLILIIAGVCVLLLGFFIYRSYLQRKHDQLEAQNRLQEHRIESLNTDIKTKQESMRRTLLRRIEFTRRTQLERMRTTEKDQNLLEKLPQWAQTYFSEQLLNNEQTSQELRDEFNTIYYHVLDLLQAEFPRLTKADQLMIVLIILRIPLPDVSLLLAMPKQSIWNRRNFLKDRLSLDKSADLDTFIHTHTRTLIEREYFNQQNKEKQ